MPRPTLEQLEHAVWSEPDFDSYLTKQTHLLRKKPVDELTAEELRLLLGQQMGLSHLVPRAIEMLEGDPLAAGDFYAGDLLVSVVRTLPFLREQPELLARLVAIAERVMTMEGDGAASVRPRIADFLADVHGRTHASEHDPNRPSMPRRR